MRACSVGHTFCMHVQAGRPVDGYIAMPAASQQPTAAEGTQAGQALEPDSIRG